MYNIIIFYFYKLIHNKMKNLFISSLIILFFPLTTNAYSQTIFVSGDIDSNTKWNADTVKVIGDLKVLEGTTLTVNRGTYIEFQGYYRINIFGSIRAIGTPADTIVFTAHDTKYFWEDTLSVIGGWAGIYLHNSSTMPDSSVFEYCHIQFAKKYDDYGGDINGGAMLAEDYGTLIIRNSLLNSNMIICYETGVGGPAGGAIYCENVNSVVIQRNSFIGNRSFDNGGAIHIGQDCHALIANNIFINNKAIWWDFVGGLLFVGGCGSAVGTTDAFSLSPTICNNYCFNNQTVNGAIYTSNLNGLVFNNVICNNYGAGIVDGHQLSTTRIFNNTIINNFTFMDMGGIKIWSKAKAYNNICWGNEYHPGQVLEQIDISEAMPGYQLFSNCVQYGDGGSNSISENPEFVDPTMGVGLDYDGSIADWSLQDWSPCINRGTPDTTGLFIPEFDIEGNPRIYGGQIEMGSYENQNVVVSISEPEIIQDKILVFPSPGTTILNIKSDEPEAYFELFTVTGSVIIQKQIKDGINALNVESLDPGIYFYKIISNKKDVIASGKWIKITGVQ
jgi:predicted outer membrane repeat protein